MTQGLLHLGFGPRPVLTKQLKKCIFLMNSHEGYDFTLIFRENLMLDVLFVLLILVLKTCRQTLGMLFRGNANHQIVFSTMKLGSSSTIHD